MNKAYDEEIKLRMKILIRNNPDADADELAKLAGKIFSKRLIDYAGRCFVEIIVDRVIKENPTRSAEEIIEKAIIEAEAEARRDEAS